MSEPTEILSAESWWNYLAAVELAQAGDPTTGFMNALGMHDSALRALVADLGKRATHSVECERPFSYRRRLPLKPCTCGLAALLARTEGLS